MQEPHVDYFGVDKVNIVIEFIQNISLFLTGSISLANSV